MSSTVVTYPIVTALVEAEKILGPDRQWKPVNETQARFLKEFFAVCRKERVPEIESLASWSTAEIRAFLARHGFTIEIKPFGERQFGTASVLDLLVEWIEQGYVTTIPKRESPKETPPPPKNWIERMKAAWASRRGTCASPAEELPAVLIASKNVTFFRAQNHEHPVVSPKTKSQDRVYMTMLDEPPSGFDLIEKAQELSHAMKPVNEFAGLIFPMVDLDQRADIGWLVGMKTTQIEGLPVDIARALQQTRLRMNEFGARAESAAVLTITVAGLPPPPHVIDRPFLIWFEREGLSMPLFVGHITEQDWKNPGDISK